MKFDDAVVVVDDGVEEVEVDEADDDDDDSDCLITVVVVVLEVVVDVDELAVLSCKLFLLVADTRPPPVLLSKPLLILFVLDKYLGW